MNIQRAYRTELDPTNVQRTAFRQHAGCARYAYNWGLQRKEETCLFNQLPHPPIKIPTAIDLHREINARKKKELGWMYEISKCAPQEALRDLDRAYRNFFEGRARHPSFRSRHFGRSSFRLTGSIRVHDRPIDLPRVGRVRLRERGYLPPSAHVLSATVSERAGRWYVSLAVGETGPDPGPRTGEPVGVDLGLHALATVSDGTVIENPRSLAARTRKLQHLQREVSRKRKGSHNREKAKRRLSRCHAKVADLRKDALHQATTMLARAKPVTSSTERVRWLPRRGRSGSSIYRPPKRGSYRPSPKGGAGGGS
ncbi:MAG: RNA-guided endonuclease InsQ/TnpB family protein, partial [Thermoplasmata archaeon]